MTQQRTILNTGIFCAVISRTYWGTDHEHSSDDFPAAGILGTQPEGKTNDRQKHDSKAAE